MRKPDFEKCTNEATKLLYKQNLSNRILDIMHLKYDKNIIFDSIQNYCLYTKIPQECFLSKNKTMLHDGCTIHDPQSNYYIVLFNASIQCFEHQNWTLAHEIGHIYLEHKNDGDIEEIEAHYFASQLFMPEYTLFMTAHEHGKITSKDITEIFGVSETAAKKRLQTMSKRKSFLISQESKEIWKAQKNRIDAYFNYLEKNKNACNTFPFYVKTNYNQENYFKLIKTY